MKRWNLVVTVLLWLGLCTAAAAQQPAPPPGQQGHMMGSGDMMMGQGMMGGQQGHMMGPGGQPGQMMGPGGMMMQGAMGPQGGSFAERPLISLMLEHREALRLTGEQVGKLRAIRAEYERDAARREAEVHIAEVDLREALAVETPDLAKVEAEVKKVAAAQGGIRFRRIQAIQSGLAVLTKEQRQQLERVARQPGMMGMMGGGMGMGPGGRPGQMMGPGGMMMGPGRPGAQPAPAPSAPQEGPGTAGEHQH